MTPPEDLRIRVEAAFPGAKVEQDKRRGDWLITPPAPVVIAGVEIATMNFGGDSSCGAYRIAVTSASLFLISQGRVASNEAIDLIMHAPTAHELLAARRRLGL